MTDTPFMVTLYFRGDNLIPEQVTKKLGVSPTDTRRKGEQRSGKKGRTYINRTGIWALEATTSSDSLSDHIEELTSALKNCGKLGCFGDAEEVFIDVFLCYESTEESNSFEFSLSNENIKELNRLGLSVQFTVSSFQETKRGAKGSE